MLRNTLLSVIAGVLLGAAPPEDAPRSRAAVSLCFVNETSGAVAVTAHAGKPNADGLPQDYRHEGRLAPGASLAVPGALEWPSGAPLLVALRSGSAVAASATTTAAPRVWCTLRVASTGGVVSCAVQGKGYCGG